MSLDKFFGSNFKILKLDEASKTKEFKNLGRQIADLREDPEEERRRVRRTNFEINETDEDMCTESNIGSSANASRLGSRIGLPIELMRKPENKAKHYRAGNDKKGQMYNTTYNMGFFGDRDRETPKSKPNEKRMKMSKETYFQFHKRRVNPENVKRSVEISPNSHEIDESFNDFNISNVNAKSRVIAGFSSTNTKGFFERRNSKDKNFYQTNKNFNSNRHCTSKKAESRSIFNLLEDHHQEMRKKYGRRTLENQKDLPDESTLINKYKEKFGLTEGEYSDWGSLVQVKTLQKPVKRESVERVESLYSQCKSSSLKEITTH